MKQEKNMDGNNKKTNRVGIVTIFNVLNYGAVLQALALYKYLETIGVEPTIINYVPKQLKHKTQQLIYNKDLSFFMNLKSFIKRFICKVCLHQEKYFHQFIFENMSLTYPCDKIDNFVINGFQTIIVGSDQVWNPEYTDNILDENYILQNVTTNEVRKMSFSSSLGSCILNEKNRTILKESLSTYCAISVREEYAKKLLNSIGINNVTLTCDPTFLLNIEQWNNIANHSTSYLTQLKFAYLLVYTFDHDKRCFQTANIIAKKMNLRVVSISYLARKPKCVYRQFSSLSPADFLLLFKNSQFVVTNSFHGTCFSLIYGKDFISINKTNNPQRIQNLLSSLNLSDRICYQVSDLKLNELHIDFTSVEKSIQNMRLEAMSYLKQNLC